ARTALAPRRGSAPALAGPGPTRAAQPERAYPPMPPGQASRYAARRRWDDRSPRHEPPQRTCQDSTRRNCPPAPAGAGERSYVSRRRNRPPGLYGTLADLITTWRKPRPWPDWTTG